MFIRCFFRLPLAICTLSAVLMFSHATPGHAVTRGCAASIEVQNGNDGGSGSLRRAVQDVCSGGTITFRNRAIINLASEIAIDKAVTIDGSGVAIEAVDINTESMVRIDGGQATRIFSVGNAGHLTLRSLRLSNGTGDSGGDGGGVNNKGTLIVQRCRFDGHRGNPTSALGGGAIFTNGNATLRIEDSAFDGNSASRGGAVFNTGDAEIYNSTFSGNIEGVGEGAIQNRGTLLGVHLTVTNNGRTDGNPVAAGGLFAFGTNSTTTLVNSIFAGNRGRDCRIISGGTVQTLGLLVQNSQDCPGDVPGDPLLQPLASNGGPTLTHAIPEDSPATIAGVGEFCLDADQRGVARRQTGCSLGAFEGVSPVIFQDSFEP